MKLRKMLSSFLVVMIMATGCSSNNITSTGTLQSNTTEKKTTTNTEKREKIVISCYLADDAQVAVREKYIDEPLAEAFPDVDIEIKMYNDRQSLMVEVAGGGGPDILDLDGPTDVAEFAKADRVLPLDTYAEKYNWEDIFYEWAYDSCFYTDKLYSLPTSFEGMMMYYNMDVMNEHGWSIPKTAEELEVLMADIQSAGLIPISFGNADYQGAVDWLYSTFLSCNAGPENLKKAIQGEIKFTDQSMMNSIQQMKDWWDAGYIGDRASQTITGTDMQAFFAEGRAVMMINGTWASSQLLATYPECNWKAEFMPELRNSVGEILPFATGGGYSINANSKNPDLAAQVLNYLFTSEERHIASIVEASYQPYPLKAFDTEKLTGMDEKLLYMYEVLDEAQEENKIGYCSWTFFPSQVRIYMNEQTDAVFLGSLSIEDYLGKTQEYIDEANAKGETPIIP